MRLFGRAYRLDQGPVKLEEAPKQGGTEQVRRIGGFMAPFSRKNLPRSLQVIGATMRQIGDPEGGALDQFSASEAEQQRYAAEQAVQARGQKVEEQRYAGELDWRQSAPQREREQYTWQRQYDAQNPEPITPYQQAQLDATRRGQDLDYSAAQARVGVGRPLRGPDAALMTRARETAESQRGLRGLVQEFSSLQTQQPTGPGAGINPLNGGVLFDRETRAMDALSARMLGLMRPTGSGATSDFEQRIYARGAPSIDNTPQQNAAIISGIERATQIADARQFFYEAYVDQIGNLNGAEQAFQQSEDYLTLADPSLLAPSGNQNRARPNLQNSNRAGPAGNAPTPGTIQNGYRFRGGDPAQRENWEPVR